MNEYMVWRNTTEIFDYFRVKEVNRGEILRRLYALGYTERGICFGLRKSEDKLLKYMHDNRFMSIFVNEVKKNAFSKNDPRWLKYRKDIRGETDV